MIEQFINQFVNQHFKEIAFLILVGLWFLGFKLPKDLETLRRRRESKRLVAMVVAGELTASEYQAAGGDPAALRKTYLAK